MLESMRNLAKTMVAKILLGLLVVAFGVWGISGIAGSAFENISSSLLSLTGFGPKDLAKVGSTTINGDDYTKTLQRELKNMSIQSGQALTLEDARKFGIDKQVLDNMIAQAAMTAEAQKLNIVVGKPVIDADVLTNKAFQDTTGKFSQMAFERTLQNNGLNVPGYYAMQMQMLTQAALLDTASAGGNMPKAMGQALTQYQGEARDVKYFDVTATAADVAQPSAAELDAQYKKTPAAYTAPEYRSAALLSVDAASLAAKQAVTPEEVQAEYDRSKQNYFTPEQRDIVQLSFPNLEAAKKAKERLAAGEDIMKIASELGFKPEDVTLMGKLKGDFLDPKIAEAAFATPEGQVSEPVQGGLATALLKPIKVNAAKQPSLDEIKDKITQAVQLAKAKVQLKDIYDSVEDARAQQMKFEDIAARSGVTLTVVNAVSASGQDKDGKDVDLPSKPELLKALFASDPGVENDALGNGDTYVWYDVRAVVPAALKPLDQVKDQVTKDIATQRVREAAIAKANKIVDSLKGGKTIDAAAQENGATATLTTDLKRNQQKPEFDGPALAAAFSVPDQGFAAVAGGDGKSARVMQVVKVALPAVMATSPEAEQLKKQVEGGMGNDMQQALVKAFKTSAGVKINEALWRLDTGGEAPPVE